MVSLLLSPLSPLVWLSLLSMPSDGFISHRINRSDCELTHLLISLLLSPLPPLIWLSLLPMLSVTFPTGSTEVTVKIDPSGWAWLVGGRKLFVWRYRQTSNRVRVQKNLTDGDGWCTTVNMLRLLTFKR